VLNDIIAKPNRNQQDEASRKTKATTTAP